MSMLMRNPSKLETTSSIICFTKTVMCPTFKKISRERMVRSIPMTLKVVPDSMVPILSTLQGS